MGFQYILNPPRIAINKCVYAMYVFLFVLGTICTRGNLLPCRLFTKMVISIKSGSKDTQSIVYQLLLLLL